ncbi:hypothetical protein Tco_1328983 [Tanacetum coccineum]
MNWGELNQAHAYYNVSPKSYYKDVSRWSADLKSKVAEDILSNGSIMEVFVLNYIFTCWENIGKILIIGTQRSDNLQADDEMDSTNDENYDAKPDLIEGDDDKLIAIFGRDELSEDEMQGYKLTQEGNYEKCFMGHREVHKLCTSTLKRVKREIDKIPVENKYGCLGTNEEDGRLHQSSGNDHPLRGDCWKQESGDHTYVTGILFAYFRDKRILQGILPVWYEAGATKFSFASLLRPKDGVYIGSPLLNPLGLANDIENAHVWKLKEIKNGTTHDVHISDGNYFQYRRSFDLSVFLPLASLALFPFTCRHEMELRMKKRLYSRITIVNPCDAHGLDENVDDVLQCCV